MTLSREEIRLRIVEAFLPRSVWDSDTLEPTLDRIEQWVIGTIKEAETTGIELLPPDGYVAQTLAKLTPCSSPAVDQRYEDLYGELCRCAMDNEAVPSLAILATRLGYKGRADSIARVGSLIQKMTNDGLLFWKDTILSGGTVAMEVNRYLIHTPSGQTLSLAINSP